MIDGRRKALLRWAQLMKFSLVVILFSLISLTGLSQTYSDSTNLSPLIRLVTEKIDQLTTNDSIYWHNEVQYRKQVRLLKERAKTYELLLLIEHPSPYVRINAFDLLLTSAYPYFVDVLEMHIEDRDSIIYHEDGCLYIQTTVAEQMAELVSSNNNWVGKVILDDTEDKKLFKIIDKIWRRK